MTADSSFEYTRYFLISHNHHRRKLKNLTLFIPGLFGPDISIHPDDLPELPALNWFLTRGNRIDLNASSPSYSLCGLFGLGSDKNNDLPVAALTRLIDDDRPPEGFWLRADPVHVSPGGDGLTLMDHHRFTLSQSEAVALASEITDLLLPYGVELDVPVPHRWYLKTHKPFALTTTPIDAVAGQDLRPCMPGGDDRIHFIQLMNDIQMVLHKAAVNQKRERAQLLPVNSVWLWGYGELPKTIDRNWSFVIGDGVLAQGLSMVSSIPFKALPAGYTEIDGISSDDNGLIVIHALQKFCDYHDLEGWLEALIDYEENWFGPLLAAYKRKAIGALQIRTTALSIAPGKYARFGFFHKPKTIHAIRHKHGES